MGQNDKEGKFYKITGLPTRVWAMQWAGGAQGVCVESHLSISRPCQDMWGQRWAEPHGDGRMAVFPATWRREAQQAMRKGPAAAELGSRQSVCSVGHKARAFDQLFSMCSS